MGHEGASSLPKCLKSHANITDQLHLCSKFATHLRVITGKVVILRSLGYSSPGKSGSVQLCSSTQIDQVTGRGMLSEKARFKKGKSTEYNGTSTKTYKVKFHVEPEFGTPGALIVKNRNKQEFFLYFVTLEAPENQVIRFECNSWVYPFSKTKSNRLFFSNTSYLPNDTPKPLMELRKEELLALRGDGMGERKKWDRIYDYSYYNDLGNPDKDQALARPILGGSHMFPYPRRGRTGRPSSNQDHLTESREGAIINLDVYVPPDERFSPMKMSEFISNSIRAVLHFFVPEAKSLLQQKSGSFESFSEIRDIFVNNNRNRVLEGWMIEKLKSLVPEELVKEIHRTSKESTSKFPIPQIIAANELAWKDDAEFAREMLAGLNPAVIKCLQRFPPESKSGKRSNIRASHIEHNLEGISLEMAMQQWRIFILDHHDYLMPFLNRINRDGVCVYASRTLLFLKDDATLKPLVIELSLPDYKDDEDEETTRVFLPATQGTEAALWQLAKTHVVVNDSGYHQLISHWLKTHAAVEPFIIATRRQLSEMHPIHRLLNPHFKDTMYINALARSIVLNAGGGLEKSLFTGKISMELTSMLYKDWRFDEQGLPADLVKRRLAIKDATRPSGVQLLFDDYPYGIDGLDIWVAIKTWVKDFCAIFYTSDNTVMFDSEIQAWWSEIKNVGHGDKCNETWWYNMTTISDLVEALTTLIWISSALHASVNFGQYAYGGYPPNRPSLCRKFIPKEGTFEFAEFLRDPDKYFLKMLPERIEMTLGIAQLEILSRHTSDEMYLGQRSSEHWTDNEEVHRSFEKFRGNLLEVEKKILARNRDPNLKNRLGPAKIPYTLLYPDTSNETSKGGLTGKGIPNSVSI